MNARDERHLPNNNQQLPDYVFQLSSSPTNGRPSQRAEPSFSGADTGGHKPQSTGECTTQGFYAAEARTRTPASQTKSSATRSLQVT
jgi:hypothetical protein